jgi:ribosomal protein S27AE
MEDIPLVNDVPISDTEVAEPENTDKSIIFKFCPSCGFNNDKLFKFCPRCGDSLLSD